MIKKDISDQSISANSSIDITTDTCPMTFVKTKIQMEKMTSGEILEVHLNDGEPLKNVPLSAEELGHTLLSKVKQADQKTYKLYFKVK